MKHDQQNSCSFGAVICVLRFLLGALTRLGTLGSYIARVILCHLPDYDDRPFIL